MGLINLFQATQRAGGGTHVPGFGAQAPSKRGLLKTMFANRPAPTTHQPQVQVSVSQRGQWSPGTKT